MCIRCRQADAPQPLGLCAVCAIQTRLELNDGFRRLTSYLGAWAEFAAWLERRGTEPPELYNSL